jgi:hypothetical protein
VAARRRHGHRREVRPWRTSLVSLRDGELEIGVRSDGTCTLAGERLTLMPSAFTWPSALVVDERPRTLIYPSRDVAGLFWGRAGGERPVSKLIGSARAEILELVGEPVHTAALADARPLARERRRPPEDPQDVRPRHARPHRPHRALLTPRRSARHCSTTGGGGRLTLLPRLTGSSVTVRWRC